MKEKLLLCEVRQAETGEHFGYAVLDPHAGIGGQFVSLNLRPREEAETFMQSQHEKALMRLHWPGYEDPEVISLANAKEFDPGGDQNVEIERHIVYRRHKAAEIIARERAGLTDGDPMAGDSKESKDD